MNQLLNGGGSGFHIQLSLEYYVFFQGSGLVVVIDATEWEYEKHMRHAKDRVVSVTCIYWLFTWFIFDSCVICCIHYRARIRDQPIRSRVYCHDILCNHKNYNFLVCDWSKKLPVSTNSLAKLLSDTLLLDSLLSDSSISQSHSKL